MLVELLVRVVDKVNNNDKRLDVQCRKAGDVVAWKLSPAEWGIDEVKNPDWRIVKADLTEDQCEALVAPELPDKAQPDKILRKNQLRLDLTQLDSLAKGAITADQSQKVAAIDTLQADYASALRAYVPGDPAKFDAIVDADAALKTKLLEEAVDADVSSADVMSIASLKEPIIDDPKDNVIGPADSNVIGPS